MTKTATRDLLGRISSDGGSSESDGENVNQCHACGFADAIGGLIPPGFGMGL